MATCRFSLVAWLLLALWGGCNSAPDDYQFFQVQKNLFATNGTSFWHVLSNQTDKNTGTLNFTLVGPHMLINSSLSALNFTVTPFKLAFSVWLSEQCTILVLVDQQLNYEIWHIIASLKYRRAIAELKSPFEVKPLSENEHCYLEMAETGNLRFFEPLEMLFAANQPVTSVLSNNTELYFVGDDTLLKMSLTKWAKANFTENGMVELVQLNRSFYDHQILALDYGHVLIRSSNGTQSCRINSLKLMQITKECKPISYSYKQPVMEQMLENKLGNDYNNVTTPAKRNSSWLIMVVCVVVTVLIIVVIYYVVVKFLCQESVPTIPYSELNSQFVGKLKSSSSIKTMKSDEGHKHKNKSNKDHVSSGKSGK